MKDYSTLAKFIIDCVGGTSNIESLTHCVTRLRFQLKDVGKADTKALEQNGGIMSVLQKGGEYQVVIGNDVEAVYDAVMKAGGLGSRKAGETSDEKGFGRFINVISGIFSPLLGLLCACGVIKGVIVFIASMGLLDKGSGTFIIINSIGDSLFYFFPVMLGYTSAEKFGMNKLVGMAVGASLLHPNIAALQSGPVLYTMFTGTPIQSQITTTLFGLPVILMSYSCSVLPIIFATFVGAKIEKLTKKYVPTVLKMFFVPAITLLLTTMLTFILIGPASTWASELISLVIMTLRNISPVLTGIFIGGLWQVLVMTGLNQGMYPIVLTSMATYGYDSIISNMLAVSFATFATVLVIYLKTRDKKLKSIALPAVVSSFFGVSEPSIYAITFPLKKPFAITSICGAVGGGIIAFFDAKTYTMAGMGIFAFPSLINPETGFEKGFYGTIIGIVAATALAFILTWLFGYKDGDTMPGDKAQPEEDKKEGIGQEVFTSPVKGTILELRNVNDEVFSQGILGKGVAVIPETGDVFSPCDGVVTALFPTGHAIGLTAASGVELLIHIGIDTVQLDGEGFSAHVNQGDEVRKGQLLVTFDRNFIKEKGYEDIVIVLVTNAGTYMDVVCGKEGTADNGLELISVVQ